MALTIANRTISKVLIVDDDRSMREGYGYPLEEMGLVPVFEDGPLQNIDEILALAGGKADAFVCDYHLRKKNFSQFDGDQLVASFNRASLPALLCTTYTDSEITVMRSKRRYIPALFKPATFQPDAILRGFERCIRESGGAFDPSRRPWRTLVRIADVEEDRRYFYVVVPGWNSQQKIRVYIEDVPQALRKQIKMSERLHAQVNLGADSADELYFSDWEGV